MALLSDHRADVARLLLPTLVVQCADDVAVPREVGVYLLRHLPPRNSLRSTLRATARI